ncbi:hypothetical protein BH10PLA2_BH10PLA2_27430 [soil metagenome]
MSRRKNEALDTVSDTQLSDPFAPSDHADDSLVDFPPRDDEPAAGSQAARNGITRKRYAPAPDPFGGHTIALTPEKDGIKARFLRSNENNAMLLQFSEKPDAEITNALKDAGLYWEPRAHSDFARGAWVIKLEEGKEWRNHAHAEKVFQDVVNHIREQNGMDPFVPGAAQAL